MGLKKRNDNGNGTVYFEQDRNQYRAMFTTPSGKRTSKRFNSKSEANDWLATMRASVSECKFIEPSKQTLGQWIEEYLTIYAKPSVRNKTLVGYVQTAAHLEPLTNIPIQQLTTSNVQDFFNKATISYSGKRRVYNFLKQIMCKAFILEKVHKNVILAVQAPKYQQREIETFTVEEIKNLFDWLQTSRNYKFYYPIILLASCSGCRLGEVLGLKSKNVLPDRIKIDNSLQQTSKTPYDSPPKTEAGKREIYLPKYVIEELQKAYKQNPLILGGYVFHTKNGTPISPRNFERAWKRILELSNIPHKHFHALRHTHATELLAKGIPILQVSRRLGHSKTSHTLNIYGHAIKDYDNKVSEKVAEIFLSSSNFCPQNRTHINLKAE